MPRNKVVLETRRPKGSRPKGTEFPASVPLIEAKQAKPKLDALNIPLEEATNFVDRTNDIGKGWSGATLGLTTGKVLKEGIPGHVVGAEPMNGKPKSRIATHLYGSGTGSPKLSILQFANEAERIKGLTSHPDSSIGSWFSGGALADKGIQLDASRVFADRDEAGRAAIAREEDETWDNEAMQGISNATHRENLKMPGTVNSKKKIEFRVPEDAAPGSKKFKGK
jgi:hypothetical protein